MNKKKLTCYLLIALSILNCPEQGNANDNRHPVGLSSKVYDSEPNPEIDKNKFTALCQFWINKAETEYGFKLKELTRYVLFSENNFLAIFSFDKLNLSCSYDVTPNYDGGQKQETTIDFWFNQKKDYEEFLRTNPFAGMKKKKTEIDYYGGIRIYIKNFPAEQQEAYKNILAGSALNYSFNVKVAFEALTQKALRQPAPGENMLAAYRDKANRFFLGTGVVKNYETARDFYQTAWSLGDDTSGMFLGFLHLEYYSFTEQNKLFNPVLAKSYFDSVCIAGNPAGNYGIGWMYQVGYDGFPKDIQKAVSYYEKGAGKGDLCCVSTLQYLYSNEPSIRSREKAIEYYERMLYLNKDSKRNCCTPNDCLF